MCERSINVEKDTLEQVDGVFVDPKTGEVVEVAKHYLEFYDKLHNFPSYKPTNSPLQRCLNGFVSGKCSGGA